MLLSFADYTSLNLHCFYLEITWKLHGILYRQSSGNPNYMQIMLFNRTFITVINLFQVFLEQKKMLKIGLNIAHFRAHIPMIEEETIEYFKKWGDSGQRGTPCSNFSIFLFL